MSELRAVLPDEEAADELEEVAVLDDASAEIMLARIKEAEEQYERMAAWYTFQLGKAKEIRDRTVAWAEGNLRTYFDMVPAKETKTQRKYELPGGTMTLKRQEPKYDVKDEELVPWLEANGKAALVQIKKEAKWGDLKKELRVSSDGASMVTEDGEIVPGVTVTPRDDKFTVKIK